MRPIIIKHTIVERPYIEGYREATLPPGRETGPIIVPIAQPPARPEPEKTYIVLPPQEQRYEPTRSPERYSEEVRMPDPSPQRPIFSPGQPFPRREDAPRPATVEPNDREEISTPEPKKFTPVDKEKINTPDNKKINEPLKFLPPEQAPQATPRKKLQHKKRNPGRQRKYHQTISLLEEYASGDTNQFDRLDPQMQRYYKREYTEYFGRDSKRSAEQRLTNRTKAARTKRDSERRRIAEISRNHTSTAV